MDDDLDINISFGTEPAEKISPRVVESEPEQIQKPTKSTSSKKPVIQLPKQPVKTKVAKVATRKAKVVESPKLDEASVATPPAPEVASSPVETSSTAVVEDSQPVIELPGDAGQPVIQLPGEAGQPVIQLPGEKKKSKKEKKAKKAPVMGETVDGNIDFNENGLVSKKARSTRKRNRERAERKERLERAKRRKEAEDKPEENASKEKSAKKRKEAEDKPEENEPKEESDQEDDSEAEDKVTEAEPANEEQEGTVKEGTVEFEEPQEVKKVFVSDKPEKKSKKQKVENKDDAKKEKDPEVSVKTAKSRLMGKSRSVDTPGANEVLSSDKFVDAELNDVLSRRLKELNFITMTQIQEKTLKPVLGGSDALIRAPTGSGKTLSFAVPLIEQLLQLGLKGEKLHRSEGTRLLILSPTKELCNQTLEVVSAICRPFPWLVCGGVTGGENRNSEKARLRKGVTVLCATPGRVLDHLTSCASFKTSHLKALVLDEADRLLDLGFEKQIREIHKSLSSDKQTLLVSATLTPKVRSLAEFCLKEGSEWIGADAEPVGEEEEETYQVPSTLKQWYLEVPCKQRLIALMASIIGKTSPRTGVEKKAIIFFSSCDSVDFHYDLFCSATWPMRNAKFARKEEGLKIFKDCPMHKLHGNLTAEERAGHMRDFAAASRGVLIATDVAARGLDVPKVDWIFQYDPPQQVPEYLHRIGRAARLGSAGNSLLFLLPSEKGYLDVLATHGAQPKELDLAKTFHFGLKGRPEQRVCPDHLLTLHDLPSYVMGAITHQVSKTDELRSLARGAYLSAQHAYQTFPRSLKSIFVFHELHLGHLAAAYALKEAPKEIIAKHKHTNFEKASADAKSKHKVIKKDFKQGSIKSTKAKPERTRQLFKIQDEFAC